MILDFCDRLYISKWSHKATSYWGRFLGALPFWVTPIWVTAYLSDLNRTWVTFSSCNLTGPRVLSNCTFSLRFFSKPINLLSVIFGSLESYFKALPVAMFSVTSGHQASTKSQGKNRHCSKLGTVPAGRLIRKLCHSIPQISFLSLKSYKTIHTSFATPFTLAS